MDESFEQTCRSRFLTYCTLYRLAKYHAKKDEYAAKAYEQIDAYLDWRDVQSL